MGTLNKDTRIAAFAVGAQQSCLFGSDLAYGGSALLGGDVVMSQRWRGLNETIMEHVIVDALAHPAPAPIERRTVLAPYPERPPV
ncbi:hypothetical protein ABGB12_02525 [Actinocorallia sp. B10E7]|uniref:hypothetical protein n=1 Tax=Actinocorallia sp. B10E7 TaxID=3153558 RepID=UPI00325C92F7